MADVIISNRRPRLPEVEGMFWTQAVDGGPLLSMAGAADHALCNRAMSRIVHTLDYDRDPGAGHGGDYLQQDPAGLSLDFVVPWTQNPYAEHVAVWVAFQGHTRSGTPSAPAIDFTLQTVAGGAIDNPGGGPGVSLSEAAGSLGAGPGAVWRGGGILGGGIPIYPIRYIQLVRVAPTPAAASYPTRDRALEYGTVAGASQRVELRIQTTDIRVLRVDIQELPLGMVVA